MTGNSTHVVIVSQEFPPDRSGNASRIHDTAKHLQKEGWEVTVLSPPPAFPHGEFDRSWNRKEVKKIDGITAYRLWAWQPTSENPRFFSRMAYYLLFPVHALLWLLFNYHQYDVVISSTPPIFTGLAALPINLFGGKPWVVDVRDLWIDASIGLGFIRADGMLEQMSRRYQRLVLHAADRVTVTTTVLGDRLVQEYDINERKVVHLPNGVDTVEYQPDGQASKPIIVYTGNVGHAQDLEACVKAMADVENPDAELKIVGDGDLRGKLEEIVKSQNLEESVTFTGLVPREKIPEILNNAMIGVAPLKADRTLDYAIPTKVYEYMACELPVIATGGGEVENLIGEAGSGVVVDNDPESIAENIDAFLANRSKRDEMGQRGRELMVDQYDRAIVAKRFDNILQELLEIAKHTEN